ncbi:MAG TPA: hypothetical protein PKY81_18030, partial [bacterium]|nr:hypothetical protein [bacterium]
MRDSVSLVFERDITAPVKPSLLNLTNGETVLSSTMMKWTASADTQSGLSNYLVQIASDSAFDTIVYYIAVPVSDTETALDMSIGRDTFYWRVLAFDKVYNYDTTVTSGTFVILNQVPVILSLSLYDTPAQNVSFAADINGGDSLNIAEDTVYYNNSSANIALQFAAVWTNGDSLINNSLTYTSVFGSGVINDNNADRTETDVFTLTINSPAINADTVLMIIVNDGNDADTDFIKINLIQDMVVDTVQLVSPALNNYTTDSTPSFAWTAVSFDTSGIDSYYLVLSSDENFTNDTFAVEISAGIAACTYNSGLADGVYYWTILARDRVNNISDSTAGKLEYRKITIDSTNPVITNIYVRADNDTYWYATSIDTSAQINISAAASDTIYYNNSIANNLHINIVSQDVNFETVYGSPAFNSDTVYSLTLIKNDTLTYSVLTSSAGNTTIITTVGDSAGLTDTFVLIFEQDITAPDTVTLLTLINGETIAAPADMIWTASADTKTGVAQSGVRDYSVVISRLSDLSSVAVDTII